MLRTIELKPARQFPFLGRHPWVHVQSLAAPPEGIATGEVVDLVTHDGGWVARGMFNQHSKLPVRLYSWDPAEMIDDAFLCRRIDEAIGRRERCGLHPNQDAVRIVFSEADRISGLVVDRYLDYLIVQVGAGVIAKRIDAIVDHLQRKLTPQAIIVRTEPAIAKSEGIEPRDEVVFGDAPPDAITINEHDVQYRLDLMQSQKTGLYLDQRANRLAAAALMRGREVLDVCSYAGGFALTAARIGQAASVHGIDSSKRAVQWATDNARANGIDNVQFEKGDCFERMDQFRRDGKQFTGIVLDPPKFAGSRGSVPTALRAYRRLNHTAMDLLPPGGILVTCSCSGRVSREDFMKMLHAVGRRAGRDLVVLARTGADADHPVLVSCPETDYLKCVICEIH